MIRRVVLGMSGGVDSAVAGLLLKKKGFDVIGIYMRNWDAHDEQDFCSADKDAEDAEWVCKQLQIPFQEVDFVKEYWNDVFSYTIEEYQNGRTPNPDIYCNKCIKFGPFFHLAQNKLEAQAVATGHYARTSFGQYLENYNPQKGVKLLQAVDQSKDQTFFLSQVAQSALQHTMFPLGSLNKKLVREIAATSGLDRVADKEDSTGICFIGKRTFRNFICKYIMDEPGNFVDVDSGEKVGEHKGLHYWTVGQRSRIAGFPFKYFIAHKNVKTNTIYVAKGHDHPSLHSSSVYVEPFYWIHETPPELLTEGKIECKFRFQHLKPLIDCIVMPRNSSLLDSYQINLAQPLRALTPGQYAVIYKGEECVGSAKIIHPISELYNS